MTRRRVVVTGLGLVTPVGNDVDTSWANIVAGVSGVRSIETFDTTGFSTRFSASVRDFDPSLYFSTKEARKMDFSFISVLLPACRPYEMPVWKMLKASILSV